jgi:hypothetical protein
MFIPSRNPEWSNGARAFMLRTAASIVTANKCAPIMRPTILSGSGATAVAHRAIIFLSGQYLSEKCVWARIFRISGRARRRNRKTLRPPEPQFLQRRPRPREAPPHRPHRVLLRLAQIQVHRRTPVRLLRLHRVRKQPHRLRQQVLPQRRQQHLPLHRRRALRHLRVRTRLPLRQLRQQRRMQARLHQQARPRERRGLCRRAVNHRCIPLRGIMCIFIRRALSTSIRTCRLIAFFIKRAASLMRLQPMP